MKRDIVKFFACTTGIPNWWPHCKFNNVARNDLNYQLKLWHACSSFFPSYSLVRTYLLHGMNLIATIIKLIITNWRSYSIRLQLLFSTIFEQRELGYNSHHFFSHSYSSYDPWTMTNWQQRPPFFQSFIRSIWYKFQLFHIKS